MIIENGFFSVYSHVNKINGKMYVGITKRKPTERWRNGKGYVENPLFYNAIVKYGWDNFDHIVIASNLTEEEACNMEILLIKQLNLQNDEYGYNLKDGGTKCSLTEETKEKIGNALRGRTHSEEVRKQQSLCKLGKKLSPEHAAAIAKGNKGRKRTQKEIEAAKKNGIRMSGDNHWTRRLGGLTNKTKAKLSKSLKTYYETHDMHEPTNKKRIMKVETGEIYDSIELAAKAVGACRSQISEAASGIRRKTAKGFHWMFVKA